MTRTEAHRRAIEAGARALHDLECKRANADYLRQGLNPPEKWADPFIPTGKLQSDKLIREAEAAITAYLAAMVLPIEEAPKDAPVLVFRYKADGSFRDVSMDEWVENSPGDRGWPIGSRYFTFPPEPPK